MKGANMGRSLHDLVTVIQRFGRKGKPAPVSGI